MVEAKLPQEALAVTTSLRTKSGLPQNRQASVLLLVLVVVAIMSLTTGTYLVSMHNEHTATRYSGNYVQTRMLAESGVEYLKVFLAQTDENIAVQGGIQENTNSMQAILVSDDVIEDFRGRFTVVAPDMSLGYYSGFQFGLEDESAKLNLNAILQDKRGSSRNGSAGAGPAGIPGAPGGSGSGGASGSSSTGTSGAGSSQPKDNPRKRLLSLPGMTEDIADAILDWIDDDDTARPLGAEASYYQSLNPAYEPRNGPISSLDELLQVRGVTPELLYGQDSNRNFVLETHETPRGALTLIENYNGQLDRGWSAYLTLSSAEQNQAPDGEDKIDVNSNNLKQLSSKLTTAIGAAEAKFIIAYRQFGAAGENETGKTVKAGALKIDFDKDAKSSIGSLLDLVGAKVSYKKDEQSPAELIESPWQEVNAGGSQDLLELLDRTTVQSTGPIVGRVNVNAASRAVLRTVPGMTTLIADQIISRRLPITDSTTHTHRHAVWLLAEGIVELEEMKALDPYLNAGGNVYSGQVIGFFESAPGQSRLEIVLERTSETTKLVGWHDLSELGPGFAKQALLGVASTPSQ